MCFKINWNNWNNWNKRVFLFFKRLIIKGVVMLLCVTVEIGNSSNTTYFPLPAVCFRVQNTHFACISMSVFFESFIS